MTYHVTWTDVIWFAVLLVWTPILIYEGVSWWGRRKNRIK